MINLNRDGSQDSDDMTFPKAKSERPLKNSRHLREFQNVKDDARNGVQTPDMMNAHQ